jgi:hypothetical protein
MTSETITAETSGTWHLGDLPVRRVGFGTMRLTGGAASPLGTPREPRPRDLRRTIPEPTATNGCDPRGRPWPLMSKAVPYSRFTLRLRG